MSASLRSQIADAARAHIMRQAHASARALRDLLPAANARGSESYARCLRAGLREVYARVPRCPLSELREQAVAWAECALASGARFDVGRKACDALRFSAEHNLASLAVPSKLVSVSSYQDAAVALATRLESRGGWLPTERDGSIVYALGMRLGSVQPKHGATWLPALGSVRLAVIAITGGAVRVSPAGDIQRTTRGVNVAFEVGQAALAWRRRQRSAITRANAYDVKHSGYTTSSMGEAHRLQIQLAELC